MPITPYQSQDNTLSCAELNKEIGTLNERMSRIMEENERAETAKQDNPGYSGALLGAFFGGLLKPAVTAASTAACKADQKDYGSDTGRLLQAYQERITHLESISKLKEC